MARTEMLTSEQVAERLNVSPDFVWRLARQRQIPFVMLGRAYRFRSSDVDAYEDAHTVKPATPPKPRARKQRAS